MVSKKFQYGYRAARMYIEDGKIEVLKQTIEESKDFGLYDDFDRGCEKAIKDHEESVK